MYPFGSLPENLAAFCAFLRNDHRFGIGPGEMRDAARALEIIDLADERAVRDALRPVLSRTVADATAFDEAFSEFFFPGPRGAAQTALLPEPRGGETLDHETPAMGPREERQGGREAEPAAGPPDASFTPTPVAEEEKTAPVSLACARYSPLDAQTAPEPSVLAHAEPAWRDAARALVRRLEFGLARRWRPAVSGQRFDLRRTLRASLQTGGEPLIVRWLRRPKRAPRIVLLIDGSRSMGESAAPALLMAVALATVTMRIEVFSFSTGLERITDGVRRAAAGETVSLAHLRRAWGGGTAIGASLRDFLQRFGDRLLGRSALVVIVSDGLDVGDSEALRDAMREIRRRSAGIVWLNPLLETPGYEPVATGMFAARSYIGTFAAVSDAADLARLARVVRVQA